MRRRSPSLSPRIDVCGRCTTPVLHLTRRNLEIAGVAIPVAEHPALRGPAVDDKIVQRGPMRVAMDHAPDTVLFQRGDDGIGVDIHYLFRFALDRASACRAQRRGNSSP